MEFHPVWVSSIEHMEVYISMVNNPFLQIARQGIQIPPGFPHITTKFSNPWLSYFLIPLLIIEIILSWSSNIFFSFLFLILALILLIDLFRKVRKRPIKKPQIPIPFSSNGTLHLKNEHISFLSVPLRKFSVEYHNLISLDFQLKPDDILAIKRYQHPNQMRGPVINWISITTNTDSMNQELLLCVCKPGWRSGYYEERTNELYNHLMKFWEH